MNGRERIRIALERGQPDVVPIWELAFNEPSIIGIAKHFMDESLLPKPKLIMDMDGKEKFQMINGWMTFAREMGLDGLTAITMAPRERVDAEHIRDALGVVQHISDFGEPYPVEGPIKEPSDIKNFKMREPVATDLFLIDIIRANLPDISIAYQLHGPFKTSWSLRGTMENLLMDYILNPELAHQLARISTDYCLKLVEMIHAKGADWIVMDGDLAFNDNPLMSPAHYDEFIGPYHKEINDLIHKKGMSVIKHSDGKLTPIIPNLIEAGFDGIHPIQPQCMDIGETKRRFGDRVCVLGNIDCSFLLVFGSPEEVDQNVKETIRIAAPGGGYIISSSNSIHPGVKPENYIAMVKAAKKYGKYPELDKVGD